MGQTRRHAGGEGTVVKLSEQYAAAMRAGNEDLCLAIERRQGLDGFQPELVSIGLLALEAGRDPYAAIGERFDAARSQPRYSPWETPMLDNDYQQMVASNVCYWAEMTHHANSSAAAQHEAAALEAKRPCVLWRPALSIDGNKWCALYGANLQDGVAGFGDSPAAAMTDFDRNWFAALPIPSQGT